MSPILRPRREHTSTPLAVDGGVLDGGLPYLAVGQGPPLVVLSGFSAEHANPTGAARRFSLRPLLPLARQFTVHLVNRKPGLLPGATMRDLARYTRAGRPRRAWAATGPELAATTTGGHLYAALLWLLGPRLASADPADMLAVIDAEDGFDAAPQLHRITAPTLIVAGDRDRNYTPELFRETADRIPGARLRLYPGKGHASIATLRYRPAVGEILEFLTTDNAEP